MAANATFKIALYSSDLQSDILDLSITNNLVAATQGGLLRMDLKTTASTGTFIADEDSYTDTTKLFIYNASTNSGSASYIYVSFDAGATVHLAMKAGEWALIPWTASGCPEASDQLDLHMWAQTAANTVEYGLFDV